MLKEPRLTEFLKRSTRPSSFSVCKGQQEVISGHISPTRHKLVVAVKVSSVSIASLSAATTALLVFLAVCFKCVWGSSAGGQ